MTEKTFPEINFPRLESEVIKWVRQFPSIKKVTFFPHRGGRYDQNKKYFLELCLDDDASSYEVNQVNSECLLSYSSLFYASLKDVMADFNPDHWELWDRLDGDPIPPFLGDISKSKILYRRLAETEFPRLNIETLKRLMRRLVEDHERPALGGKPLKIDRILLYHWATPLQRYYHEAVPVKYALVFELPYERLHAGDYGSDDPLEKFIADTQHFGAPPQRSMLFGKDFSDAYLRPPSEDFWREWDLIPLCRGDELPLSVRTSEGRIVLYGSPSRENSDREPSLLERYINAAKIYLTSGKDRTGQAPTMADVYTFLEKELKTNGESLATRGSALLPDRVFRRIWREIPDDLKRKLGEKTHRNMA